MSTILNNLKEEFSYAHVHAVVAAAGYSYKQSSRPEDNDGIDLTIRALGASGSYRRPTLDVQVKATSSHLREDREYIFYDLKVQDYRKLCSTDYSVPCILILVVLPPEPEDWLSSASPEELCLRKCSYWKSLEGAPDTQNEGQIRIKIPKTNLFSVESLRQIMEKVRNRQVL